jgi:flagellar motility protein MotE (MotC chaperone)
MCFQKERDMRRFNTLRHIMFFFLAIICIKLGVLGFYFYERGFRWQPLGHNQAIAEDKVKDKQAIALDDLKLFEELENKRRELAAREEELRKKEEELLILKKDIENKLAKLSQLQTELQGQLQKNVEAAKQSQETRLKHLVGAYSAMKPDKAASLIEKLNDDVALQILSAMKSKDVGAILSFVETEKAARLSQRLAREAR